MDLFMDLWWKRSVTIFMNKRQSKFRTSVTVMSFEKRCIDQLFNNSLKKDFRSFCKTWKLYVNILHIDGPTNSCDIAEHFKNKFSNPNVTISATGGDNNNTI